MIQPLDSDYVCSDFERVELEARISLNPHNPYTDYTEFYNYILRQVDSPPDSALRNLVAKLQSSCKIDRVSRPFFVIDNLPIDRKLPEISNVDPIGDKCKLKTTFIAEGVLTFFAVCTGLPSIGYKRINDGSIFHDIFPKNDQSETRSQKSLQPIGFHRDLGNHAVRPDFLNILSLRSLQANEILTSFARARDVIDNLTDAEKEVLAQPLFYTDFNSIEICEDREKLKSYSKHSIVSLRDPYELNFFEWFTHAISPKHEDLVEKISGLLHEHKYGQVMRPGQLVSIANNTAFHAREVGEISDPAESMRRWSMKTVNVYNLTMHNANYDPSMYGIVAN